MERKIKPNRGQILLGAAAGIAVIALLILAHIYANTIVDAFIGLAYDVSQEITNHMEGNQ